MEILSVGDLGSFKMFSARAYLFNRSATAALFLFPYTLSICFCFPVYDYTPPLFLLQALLIVVGSHGNSVNPPC